MMQIAQVRQVLAGGQAQVAVVRKGACSHDCSKCGGCTPTANLPTILTVADNHLGAGVGDTVLVESASAPIIGMAAALYLLPMLLLVLGYALGQTWSLGELGSIGTAAGGFVLAVVGLMAWDRHLKKKSAVHFTITQIKGG